MSFSVKLFEKWSSANDHLILSVVMARHFPREVSVGESDSQFVAVHETSSHNLNHCVALAGTAFRINFINANWSVEEAAITACENVRKYALFGSRSLLGVGLDDHFRRFDHGLASMANVTLTPRVGSASHIKSKCRKFAARNLVEFRQLLAFNIVGDLLGIPKRLGVVQTSLPVNAESPSVEVSLIAKRSSVAETSSTRL